MAGDQGIGIRIPKEPKRNIMSLNQNTFWKGIWSFLAVALILGICFAGVYILIHLAKMM
jgi:hypothetical protein